MLNCQKANELTITWLYLASERMRSCCQQYFVSTLFQVGRGYNIYKMLTYNMMHFLLTQSQHYQF